MKRCWIVMETRLKANPEILRQRREIVEHPFGSIKQWMNQGAFLMRGLEKVRAEFSLTALAYNMTRVPGHNIDTGRANSSSEFSRLDLTPSPKLSPAYYKHQIS